MSLYLDFQTDGADWPNREASRFVKAAGMRWHVQVMGQGPALLLLHGTGSSTHSWRDVMPLLATRYTVIAPDLPGHAFTNPAPGGSLSLPGMSGAIAMLLHERPERSEPRVAGGGEVEHRFGARALLAGIVGMVDQPPVVRHDDDLLAIGVAVALEDLGRGGLARTVGTEQRDALAGAHLEGEPVDSVQRPVGLAQTCHGDRWIRHRLLLGRGPSA